MPLIQFYDSARPHLIPSTATHAALYFDGIYAAPAGTLSHLQRRWITVIGGTDAARHTGIADFEPGNRVHDQGGQLRAWAAERQMMNRRARIYCDRADAGRALELVRGIPALWWISTLDNQQWSADALVAELRDHWGADIAPGDMWGNQFTDRQGLYDISNLFGVW